MTTSFSGGEIRMGGDHQGGLHQGTPISYRMLVTMHDGRPHIAEAVARDMEPLLVLLQQFINIGYEFVCLERVYGG